MATATKFACKVNSVSLTAGDKQAFRVTPCATTVLPQALLALWVHLWPRQGDVDSLAAVVEDALLVSLGSGPAHGLGEFRVDGGLWCKYLEMAHAIRIRLLGG